MHYTYTALDKSWGCSSRSQSTWVGRGTSRSPWSRCTTLASQSSKTSWLQNRALKKMGGGGFWVTQESFGSDSNWTNWFWCFGSLGPTLGGPYTLLTLFSLSFFHFFSLWGQFKLWSDSGKLRLWLWANRFWHLGSLGLASNGPYTRFSLSFFNFSLSHISCLLRGGGGNLLNIYHCTVCNVYIITLIFVISLVTNGATF